MLSVAADKHFELNHRVIIYGCRVDREINLVSQNCLCEYLFDPTVGKQAKGT